MAVPAPSIAPAVVESGSNFAHYVGPCVAIGVNQVLNIDLKYLTKYVRTDTDFRKNLKLTIESLSPDFSISAAGEIPDSAFVDSPGEPNEYVQINVNSVTGTEQIIVEVQQVHSLIR